MVVALRLSEAGPRVLTMEDPRVLTWGFTFINLACAGLLLVTLDAKHPLSRVLQARPLVMIGRVSYGLYLFNEPVGVEGFRQFEHIHSNLLRQLLPIGFFFIILGMAQLSFRYLESPFLRLKHIFAPRPGAVEDPPPAGEEVAILKEA